jgi:hypothetical protein
VIMLTGRRYAENFRGDTMIATLLPPSRHRTDPRAYLACTLTILRQNFPREPIRIGPARLAQVDGHLVLLVTQRLVGTLLHS